VIGIGLAISFAVIAYGQEAVVVPASPPPSNGVVTLDCNVTTLQGRSVKARVRLDYNKSPFAPWVSVDSSDSSVLASMPLTEAVRRSTPDAYASFQVADKQWQIVGYEIESSTSDRTTIKFHKQDAPAGNYGPYHNTLSAAGICTANYVSRS
jgi:hypothetical protein